MATAQDVFELKCILKNIKIRLCSRIQCGVKQLLALITSDDDIVLHYTYGDLTPVIKRIPWLTDNGKSIQGLCFDPSSTWLLVVSLDGSLYIIPALSLTDKKQKIDCKWSLGDVTHFGKHSQTPEAKPTSVVWWQTLDSNQNALVGVLCDLRGCVQDGAVSRQQPGLGITLGTRPREDNGGLRNVLINGKSGQQWRLLLEQNSGGSLWPPETTVQSDDLTRSRLYSLKQMGVDKLYSLKQRLVDGRNRRDSQSDTASESSEVSHSGPELLPCLCDTFFAPQFARNRYLYSAFYKPTSLLTVHAVDVESAPLYVFKLQPETNLVLLTDKLIYTVNNDATVLRIISMQLAECRVEGDAKFNPEALVGEFLLPNESVLDIYKMLDLSAGRAKRSRKDKQFDMPKTIEDLHIKTPKIDTCLIVTSSSIYKLIINKSPVTKFVKLVIEENSLDKAEKISQVFGLNLQQLLEACGDLLVSKGSFHSGIILYKQAKVHLLKRVLKLAISADCRTLLKFIHLCLCASRVDMSMTTKIHIGNLAVMAYTELILRFGGSVRANNTKDFMNFLRHEEYYDQVLAVNVACQASHWNIVTFLARTRGLQPEVIAAFGQILQSARAPRVNDHEFLIALSEPSLIQSLMICPQSAQEIFHFIRSNIDGFSAEILQRFAVQLDPSQPSVMPLVARNFSTSRCSSSLETTLDSVDFNHSEKEVVVVKDLIETFLVVVVTLVSKTSRDGGYSVSYMERMKPLEVPHEDYDIRKLPVLQQLSCGYEHAGVVRNNNVYTMGLSAGGCLGLGPLLTQSSPPKLVHILHELRVKVLSVSCGKKHTFALTDYGIYAWGSNAYGQLGLGSMVQETPYPQIISQLSLWKVTQIVAGQYHSIALTSTGDVFTWGWGIHGQLGHGNCENLYLPRLLKFKHKITQVAAGHAHSLILTSDGKLFGFGSNVFGQLENCQLDANKATRPVWVLLMPDMYIPIERIASGYFHNIAIRADQEVYTWGASPQEVRIVQSKNVQKQNGLVTKTAPESWKSSVHVYSGGNKRPIEQIAVGYRHSVVLHHGGILWGRNKDDELNPPVFKSNDNFCVMPQKFLHISCGLDYIMAIDQVGKILAWGNPSLAQTILGRSFDEDTRSSHDGKVILFKNTRRVIKFPNNLDMNSEFSPIEIPGLPTMAITFNPTDHRLLLDKHYVPNALLRVENADDLERHQKTPPVNVSPSATKYKFGAKTLHYALEFYHGFYDTEAILSRCLEVDNQQAASKLAMLDGHFCDSLGFQLTAFKKYMDGCDLDLESIFVNKEMYDIKEKEQDFVDFMVKNIQDDFGHKTYINSPGQLMSLSSSSSLDSIRQWGDEVEHQGGCESPCHNTDMGDVRQNMTHYVQAVQGNNSTSPISSVSQKVSTQGKTPEYIELEIKDKLTRNVINNASQLIEFYIQQIYASENHILMQNVLMKCIEFWLGNKLPVAILENVLLKNMDKYFYPLSILLFCKNFTGDLEEIIKDEHQDSAGFLKEFSTKFCLQLCSMVLENVNKA